MLPSVVSRQVADSVAAFLRAAFPLNSPLFNGENNDNVSMLEQFLAQPETLLKDHTFPPSCRFVKVTYR